MTTQGVAAVYVTSHNWGKTAKFFQTLGYELEFDTGHNSGQLRNGASPYVFVAEVPADQPTEIRLVLATTDANDPAPGLDVVTPFARTHFGTREATVRDPDGNLWTLQAPAAS